MASGPSWDDVLAHRPPETRGPVRERFESVGVTPAQVQEVLEDGGDRLYQASSSGTADWATPYGGLLAVALLAAEVGALTAHLTSRSSQVRALAVENLLDDFSAVAVAGRLGVSRQKVYDIARADTTKDFIDRVPWRMP